MISMPLEVALFIVYVIMVIGLLVWDFEHSVFTPKDIYDKGLNWFGSIFIFTLFMIFNPFGLLIRIIYWAYRLLKWLFTVGR